MFNVESLDHFYSRIISWDNLIKRGYFNITKDKGTQDKEYLLNNPYAKYDSLFAGYFNLHGLVNDIKAYKFVQEEISKAKIKKIRKNSTTPILYTIPKDSNTRRPLKYPNFYSYCVAASILVKNKDEIIQRLKKINIVCLSILATHLIPIELLTECRILF